MLQHDALDLGRPNAVAGALDDVVVAAHIPQVVVLVTPCGVAGVIPTVVDGLGGLLGVAIVTHHDARRRILLVVADADFARLAVLAKGVVVTQHADVIERHDLAHGAGLGAGVVEVGNRERRLGLAKSLIDGKPCVLAPEVVEVGVERLARSGAVLELRQVVGVNVALHHEAVHRGWAAKRAHVVLAHHVEDLVATKAIEVIGKDARLHGPRAIELAPHGLAPTSVGNGEVQATVANHVVPELCGDGVRQRIGAVVQDHLGVARGAAREVHDHGLVDRDGHATPEVTGRSHATVEVDPALAVAGQLTDVLGTREHAMAAGLKARLAHGKASTARCHKNLLLEVWAIGGDGVHNVGDCAGIGADNCLARSSV